MTRGRWAGKPDANQAAIIKVLRQAGARVLVISGAGRNAPDLAVARNGRTCLLEVKNPATRGHIRPGQARWLADWPGETAVVSTPEEALAAIGAQM